MNTSDAARAMIKHHEGVRQKPYRCPARLWTVGIGHVLYPTQARLPMAERDAYGIEPQDARIWSMAEVDDLLAKDLARFERGVARYCPGAVGRQGHFDSLVSLSFNIGLGNLQRSSVRMRYNRGDFEGAAEAFLLWSKAGGKVLPGLVNRRRDEMARFLTG